MVAIQWQERQDLANPPTATTQTNHIILQHHHHHGVANPYSVHYHHAPPDDGIVDVLLPGDDLTHMAIDHIAIFTQDCEANNGNVVGMTPSCLPHEHTPK